MDRRDEERPGTGRLKVRGRSFTAQRVAWELAHGPLPPGVKVLACPDEPSCVRVEHLRRDPPGSFGKSRRVAPGRQRGRRGGGSLQQVRPGVWKLAVRTLPNEDGRTFRVHRTIGARNEAEAAEELARFVTEVRSAPVVPPAEKRHLSMDEAIERFLSEHLRHDNGREDKTIRDYRGLHQRWFAPEIGRRLVRDVDRAAIDRIFALTMGRSPGPLRARLAFRA